MMMKLGKYVLEGTLSVRVGDEDLEAKAGAAVFVPRGTAHTYWNPGRLLGFFELIQEIHATKERTPAMLRAVFQKYDSELL